MNPRRGVDQSSNQTSPRHADGIPESSDANGGGANANQPNGLPQHSRDASLTVSLLSQELGELDPGNGAVMGDFAATTMFPNGLQSPVI